MKCKIVGEVKLGLYTEAETSDLSSLLEKVIKVSNIGKREYGMHGITHIRRFSFSISTILSFIGKTEFSLLKEAGGATVVIFAYFRKNQNLFFV